MTATETRSARAINGRNDRVLEGDDQLELRVLHLALLNDRTPELIAAGLAPAMFQSRRRGSIWQAALDAHDQGVAVDDKTIKRFLPADVTENDLISVITDGLPPNTTHGPEWVDELRRMQERNRLRFALTRAEEALDAGVPVETIRQDLGTSTTEQSESAGAPTSWEPIDLNAALAGIEAPGPVMWKHSRGHRLLYEGRTHTFQGASESCKSWAAQSIVVECLTGGHDVLYIDYEDDEAGVVSRLLALGATREQILAHLTYVRPDEPLLDRQDRYTRAGLRFAELLEERPWRLGVVDGVTEAMTTEGLEINDNADSARFNRRIARPIADTGAAELSIDHVTKNGEGGRYAIGGQHKLAGLTGAAYKFETERPVARALGSEPVTGTIKVTVVKDRPGHVRGRALDGKVGVLRVTSWPDTRVDVEMIDPADLGDEGADIALAGRILTYLATYEGASANQLEKAVTGNNDAIRATATWTVGKGWIEVRKEGNAHRHYLTAEGRKQAPE